MAVSKDARAAAAKKRATARAQGRTRSTMATPGKVQEAGVTAASVAKLAGAVAKRVTKSSKPKPKPKPKATAPKPTKAAQERAKTAARVKKREEKRTTAAKKADEKRRKKLTPQQRMSEMRAIETAKNRMIKAEERYKAVQRSRPSGSDRGREGQVKGAMDDWLRSKNAYDSLVKHRNPKIYGS
jgi:hypothetical protein